MVFCVVNFSVTVVEPLPPFHVILVVRLPVSLLIGTVTFDEPPAARPLGVQVRKLDVTVPVLFARLTVVEDDNFAQATAGFGAADAGSANGTTSADAAVSAIAAARVRTERCMDEPPPG
jgi:hypothetical protein